MKTHALAKERTHAFKTHGAGGSAQLASPDLGAPIKPPKSGRQEPRE